MVYTFHRSENPYRMHYGVLLDDGTLLESTVDDRHHGERTFIPPDPHRFDSVAAIAREGIYAGPLYHAYGHFIIESCQRLWWALDHPELPIVWTADDRTVPELNRWERDILDVLGIRNEIIIVTRPTRFDLLHVPDAGYKYADWTHPQHIAFLAAYDGPRQQDGTRLWLSRDPARGAGVINRHIIERRLRDLGWTIATFEKMSVRDQLDALAGAEVIAGEEASSFHNLLLLKNVTEKQFHVFRRHGPEHLSFTTIGRARAVNQQFHSCSQDAVLSVRGRAVVRLAPNAAQYLSHLAVPIPAPPPPVPSRGAQRGIRTVNRLARLTRAEAFLQVGSGDDESFDRIAVALRDVVEHEFAFDVRSYRDGGAHFYEVSVEQFLTWFAGGRIYDLVRIDARQSWSEAAATAGAVFTRAAHPHTVVVLDVAPRIGRRPARSNTSAARTRWLRRCQRNTIRRDDVDELVQALRRVHPWLDLRVICSEDHTQVIVWQRCHDVRPRFGVLREVPLLLQSTFRRRRDVTEERAMTVVHRWLHPRSAHRYVRTLIEHGPWSLRARRRGID